jgi:hypothetical protein
MIILIWNRFIVTTVELDVKYLHILWTHQELGVSTLIKIPLYPMHQDPVYVLVVMNNPDANMQRRVESPAAVM